MLWLLAGCRRALLALESARSRAREVVLPREAAWPGVARLGSALARPAVAAARASLAGGIVAVRAVPRLAICVVRGRVRALNRGARVRTADEAATSRQSPVCAAS